MSWLSVLLQGISASQLSSPTGTSFRATVLTSLLKKEEILILAGSCWDQLHIKCTVYIYFEEMFPIARKEFDKWRIRLSTKYQNKIMTLGLKWRNIKSSSDSVSSDY